MLFLRAFLDWFFPQQAGRIDWSIPWKDRCSEIQTLRPRGRKGYRVDLLFEVSLLGGGQQLVLIHIEIQTAREANFEVRLFDYTVQTRARHRLPVACFALLADADPDWRPGAYEEETLGTSIRWEPSYAKFQDHRTAPGAPTAPSAVDLVVQAHLRTLDTRRKPQERFWAKLERVELLHQLGLDPDHQDMLLRVLDAMMALPDNYQERFEQELAARKEARMALVSPMFQRMERQVTERVREELLPIIESEVRRHLEPELRERLEPELRERLEPELRERLEPELRSAAAAAELRGLVIHTLHRRLGIEPDEVEAQVAVMSDLESLRTLLDAAIEARSLAEFQAALPKAPA
jgi:hypothetical protein